MALQFSRNTKVYLEQGDHIWEIPVLDGFSFSQSTNTSEITLNEMSDINGNSRRARQMFTDSYAPAEWSFSSYIRPNAGVDPTANCVEEALWANFVAANSYDTGNADYWALGVTKATNSVAFDFTQSDKTALGTFNLYFILGACSPSPSDPYNASTDDIAIYKIENCVSNSATINFDIDGIATIDWSGFGKIIKEEPLFPATGTLAAKLVDTNTSSTSNFIRNRLTSLQVVASDSSAFPGAGAGVYDITLTGGSISFENNISYLTPETLCTINQPLEHVTGTRAISGSFTCYLGDESGGSQDLFESIIEATSVVTNDFALTFKMGGSAAPNLTIALGHCHLEVPSHSIEDVISVETNFHALPTTVDTADEAILTYLGKPEV